MMSQNSTPFTPGTEVIYGLHGKCSITRIEERQIGGKPHRFYRLDFPKDSFSRAKKTDASILLPIEAAVAKGLRTPITAEQIQPIYDILENREFYFTLDEDWKTLQLKLENEIFKEGAVGLAKVVSFLHVLMSRDVVPPAAVSKFWENIQKLLIRELSDALGQPMRIVEGSITKKMRSKLQYDQ